MISLTCEYISINCLSLVYILAVCYQLKQLKKLFQLFKLIAHCEDQISLMFHPQFTYMIFIYSYSHSGSRVWPVSFYTTCSVCRDTAKDYYGLDARNQKRRRGVTCNCCVWRIKSGLIRT